MSLAVFPDPTFAEDQQRRGGEGAKSRSTALGEFLSTLDEDQRGDALYAFDDDERFDFRLAPLGLEGLQVGDMSDAQWRELESFLGSILSPVGLAKMNTIRSLEVEVAELEGGLIGLLMDRFRNPKRYFLAVFGNPAEEGAWGLRFDGHHLSLNWTWVPDKPLAVTPVFWGGQPRAVPEELERSGLRVLLEEESVAIGLINGLSMEERQIARVPFTHGSNIRRPMFVSGDVPLTLDEPRGLARKNLSRAHQKQLDDIIEIQLGNFLPAIADHYRLRIATQEDSIRFAMSVPKEAMGRSLSQGDSLYYRIQGDSFIIEYDNTSEEADHIHVVWRDLENDFGQDILAEHLATHH